MLLHVSLHSAWNRCVLYPLRSTPEFLKEHEAQGSFELESNDNEMLEAEDYGLVAKAMARAKEEKGDPLAIFLEEFEYWCESITDKDPIEMRARA